VSVVTVRFRTADEGGRPSPVNSDYRAQLVFHRDGELDVEHDCVFDFSESEQAIERDGEKWLPLGVEDSAVIAPFDADRMSEVMVAGTEFEVFEGRTLVGAGRVVKSLARRS
jgi:hypothetical protein